MLEIALLFAWPSGFVCHETPEPTAPLPPFFVGDTVCRPDTECTEPKKYFECLDTQSCHDQYEQWELNNAGNNPDTSPPPVVPSDPIVLDGAPVPEPDAPVTGD